VVWLGSSKIEITCRCPLALFRVVSGCGRIGRISRTMATLETGQDPPYEASEHREDMSQRRREMSQLVGLKRRSVATRDARSKRPSKRRSFGGVVVVRATLA